MLGLTNYGNTRTIVVDVTDDQMKLAKMFSQDLGFLMLNMAVIIAPLDTGNLRRSIELTKNNKKTKEITYNLMNANYIKFLEEGLGPVKQYTGFISQDTTIAIVEAVINYILTGSYPFLSKKPTIELKDTNKLFSRERQILRTHDLKNGRISADIRRSISRLSEQNYRIKTGNPDLSLKIGSSSLTSKSFSNKSNRGLSQLNKIYKKNMDKEFVRF